MFETAFTDWLLEAETPSIRYFTLRDLLDQPPDSPAVQAAQRDLMAAGPVPAILSHQTASGAWANEQSYYTPKYVSSHWSMMLLTELGVDGQDPRFQQGIDFMLADTRQWQAEQRTEKSYGMLCFWGNILRYAVHGDRLDDTAELLELVDQEVFRQQWRCPHNDGLGCAWGAARALWGLAAIPKSRRSPKVQAMIDEGLRYLLNSYTLSAANYPTPGSIHKLWHKLNFPLFYQTDILFVLRVLAEFDVLQHPAAQAGVDWLRGLRRPDGHWRGTSPYKSRTWRSLGNAEETHRWVSLYAARILHAA